MADYKKLGSPLPGPFYSNEQGEWVDNNNFDYPPVTGGQLGQDILRASPGGLDTRVHHWTGGFYGKGGSNTDKFMGPKSNPYPSGEFGNLYSSTADPQLNDSFEILPFAPSQEDPAPEPQKTIYDPNSADPSGHEPKNPFGLVPNQISWHGKQVSVLWAAGFACMLILIYFVLNLWTTLGMKYLNQTIGEGGIVTTKTLLFVSLAGTLFLIFFCWMLGVSFLSILGGGGD